MRSQRAAAAPRGMAEDEGSIVDSGTWHGVAPSHVGQALIHGKEGMWQSGMKNLTFKATEGQPWQPHRARGPGPKMVAAAAAATRETQRQLLDNLHPDNLRRLHGYRYVTAAPPSAGVDRYAGHIGKLACLSQGRAARLRSTAAAALRSPARPALAEAGWRAAEHGTEEWWPRRAGVHFHEGGRDVAGSRGSRPCPNTWVLSALDCMSHACTAQSHGTKWDAANPAFMDVRDKRTEKERPWLQQGAPSLDLLPPGLAITDPHDAVVNGTEADIRRVVRSSPTSGSSGYMPVNAIGQTLIDSAAWNGRADALELLVVHLGCPLYSRWSATSASLTDGRNGPVTAFVGTGHKSTHKSLFWRAVYVLVILNDRCLLLAALPELPRRCATDCTRCRARARQLYPHAAPAWHERLVEGHQRLAPGPLRSDGEHRSVPLLRLMRPTIL